MEERKLTLPETTCNIPMPEGVRPPKGRGTCDSCGHVNVCKYPDIMKRYIEEINKITEEYKWEHQSDIFKTSVNCECWKSNSTLR